MIDLSHRPEDVLNEVTDLAAKARRCCGCYACQEGYEVGAHTIAAKPRNSTLGDVSVARPMSCLAPTILHHMLDGRRR